VHRKYWNRVGRTYDDEIFDVRANDRARIVEARIKANTHIGAVAHDFGCGTGKFTPFVAKRVGRALGLDISKSCLRKAKAACRSLNNAEFRRVDLSGPERLGEKADFGLCVNVLLSKSHRRRCGILRFIKRHVRKGGRLVLVAPALESALLASHRRIQWNLKDGVRYRKASADDPNFRLSDGASIERGLATIEGVPTKHYLREELEMTLCEHSFQTLEIAKVEYDWSTEFQDPPKWMRKPWPWDWLAVAERK